MVLTHVLKFFDTPPFKSAHIRVGSHFSITTNTNKPSNMYRALQSKSGSQELHIQISSHSH